MNFDKEIIANKLVHIEVSLADEVENYLIRSAIEMVYQEAYSDAILIIKQLESIIPRESEVYTDLMIIRKLLKAIKTWKKYCG